MKQFAQLLLLQLFHACLLLIPTLAFWPRPIDKPLYAFVAVILTAAMSECLMTRSSVQGKVAIYDPTALIAAQAVGVIMLLGFWAAQLEALSNRHIAQPVQIAAAIFCVIGIGLRLSAIFALGPRFRTDIVVESVVRIGIYKYLKHPSEFGLLFLSVSAPSIIGSYRTSTAMALVLTPISIWRIHRENLALDAKVIA